MSDHNPLSPLESFIDRRFNLLDRRLEAIDRSLTLLEKTMSAELDRLTTEVEENNSVIQSAIQLITNIHDLLVAAGTDKVKLTELANSLDTNANALAAAVTANTPAE